MILVVDMDERLAKKISIFAEAATAVAVLWLALREVGRDLDVQIALEGLKRSFKFLGRRFRRFWEAYINPQPVIEEAEQALEEADGRN
jgi:hypothetical protein